MESSFSVFYLHGTTVCCSLNGVNCESQLASSGILRSGSGFPSRLWYMVGVESFSRLGTELLELQSPFRLYFRA